MTSTTNSNSLISSVPKLTGENYHDWRFAIEMVLRRSKAWETVTEGTAKKPITRDKLEEWETKAADALVMIGLTVDPSQYQYIREAKDGVEAWESLKKIYEKDSRANRVALKRQFYGFRHQTSAPIRDYISGITTLAMKLKAIKVALADDDIIDVLLFNLDNTWSTIAATLCASTTALTLAGVTGALLDEEGRKGGAEKPEPSDHVGMMVKTKPPANRRAPGSCWVCGKTTHKAWDCPDRADKKGEKPEAHTVEFAF